MCGVGTNDEKLIVTLISVVDTCLRDVTVYYLQVVFLCFVFFFSERVYVYLFLSNFFFSKQKYKTNLAKAFENETSGDYKKLLLEILKKR